MYQDQLKINKERIPILIGKDGSIKKRIESRTSTKIKVDSDEGDVFIKGEDSYNVYIVRMIINAISRGFNPDIAMMLTLENTTLEIINIKDYAGKSKARLAIVKARVIGTQGKSKHLLEQLTHTDISVYGKTVAIIGRVENTILAKRAIEMVLKGSKHGNVYSWLERQHENMRNDQDINT